MKKHSRVEWAVAGAVLVSGLVWYAYEMHRIKTPDYQQEQEVKLRAELDQEAEQARIEAQSAEIAREIQQLMTASLQQCADGRDADAVKHGANLALVRYAECLQQHKSKFGLK